MKLTSPYNIEKVVHSVLIKPYFEMLKAIKKAPLSFEKEEILYWKS